MSRKEIVYFVGAGLSKALEKPGKPIPLMYDFVSVMADYPAEDAVILQTLARLEYAGVFRWSSAGASDLARRVVHQQDRSGDMLVRLWRPGCAEGKRHRFS